jgi:hypothetical protein
MSSLFANVDNSHNAAPIMSSNVGPVQGCGGPANSPDALKQDGVFQMESTGGKYKKRKSSKKRRPSRRRHMKKKTHKRRRYQRGGQAEIDAERSLQSGESGTPPLVSDTNTTELAKVGGKSRRRRNRKSRKYTRKHTRKNHRRRRAMKGGDGVYAAALTPSYSMPGEADTSSLASPAPIVNKNYCLDTFKHVGDQPPYNEVWKGIN